MRKITTIFWQLLIVNLLLMSSNLFSQNNVPYDNPCSNLQWRLVFQDDFDNLSNWIIKNNDDSNAETEPNSCSVFIDDNVTIQSINNNNYLSLKIQKGNYHCTGDLYSASRQNASPNPESFNYEYTSGSVWSKCNFQFKYGYTEARIKFPIDKGTWSCYWLFEDACIVPNTNWSEIDIAEIWGHNNFYNVHQYSSNLHLSSNDGLNASVDYNFPQTGVSSISLDSFHIYGCEWSPNYIKIYLDNVLIHTYPTNPGIHDFDDIVFDNVVEYIFKDGTHYSNFPTTPIYMYVDWVKVFQYDENFAKEPYIINPKDDPINNGKQQVQLLWQLPEFTLPSTQMTIKWGTDLNNYPPYGIKTVVDNSVSNHFYNVILNGLIPNTKYDYEISGGGYNYTGFFISPPSSNASSTFFYASGNRNIRSNNQSYSNKDDIDNQILNQLALDPSSQTLLIQSNGFVSSNNYDFWRDEYFDKSLNSNGNLLRSMIPIVGSISQNERKEKCINVLGVETGNKPDGNAMNFHTYFPFNFHNPYILNNGDFEYNHSMDYGPVHICFPELEYKNTSASDQAMTFINNDFAISSKEWKVMSFAYPLKSLNGDVLDEYSSVRLKAINNGVQLVIMGSENYYAHWVDSGVHFLILGNGGETTNGIDDQKIANDNKLVQASTVPHFAKFKIDGNMMYVDVIQGADYNGYSKGRVIEKFAIPKNCYITNTQTWNAGTYPIITDYFQIANGGNLKIESEVQLLKDAIVKVYKGAVLNLTGANALLTSVDAFTENIDLVTKDASGNITNSYKNNFTKQTNFWSGIEIKSNPTIDQLNFSNQGVLYVSNGATIENAKVAVAIKQSMPVNGQDVWKGGGILRADQANFVNNITDIEMYPYQGTKAIGSGTINLADRTRITRSVFKTDNDFLDLSQTPKHVVLKGVRGVLLYGNDFENTNTSLPLAQKGIGIQAIESSFNLNSVSSLFLNTTNDNSFSGLLYGVKTYNTSENGVTTIKGSTFSNCYTSVYLANSYSANVLWNSIDMPETQVPNGFNQMPYGIYLDGGRGFKVENNTVTTQSMAQSHGIIVNGTGATPNQIYNNILTNLNVGTQAQNSNYGDNSAGNDVGLHFFCNNYEGTYDVWVAKSNSYSGSVGIASDQQMSIPNQTNGNDVLPAGNDFSNTYRMAAYDYDNTDGNNINGLYYYYEYNAAYRAEPTYINNIITQSINEQKSCPDNSGSGTTPISQLYTNMSAAKVALNSSSTLLAIWKDGGNANLDEEVETTQPWDVYVQFNNLLAESPYLSDEVLIANIQNPAFTSLMIKLIMVANPQASRNDEIMNMIRDRIPAMPQSYIDEIEAGEGTVSQLDLLENDVASDYHLLRMIGEDIKTNYRNDTINDWAPDSLLAFVSRQNGLMDKYELATIYLNSGLYGDMNEVLTNIPSNFELDEEKWADYYNFVSVFGIAQTMYENETYSEYLDDEQRTSLETIIATKGAGVSQLALSLLMRDNPDYQYMEEVLQPSENPARQAKPKSNNSLNSITDSFFKLYPNPATDYFTLEYNLAETTYSNVEMIIYDATGREVLSKTFTKPQDETLIDVRGLSKGMYSVSFVANGKVLSVEKLTIVK